MATYMYFLDGRSLEQVFAPLSGATPGPPTYFYDLNTGQDLNQLFFPLQRARQAPPTYMYLLDGRDLADVFDTEAGVPVAFTGARGSRPSSQNGGATASVILYTDGQTYNGGTPQGTPNTNSKWFSVPRAGVGNDFEFWWNVAASSNGNLSVIPHTEGTWGDFSTEKRWTWAVAVNQFGQIDINMAIRRKGTTAETAFQFRLSAQGGGNA